MADPNDFIGLLSPSIFSEPFTNQQDLLDVGQMDTDIYNPFSDNISFTINKDLQDQVLEQFSYLLPFYMLLLIN